MRHYPSFFNVSFSAQTLSLLLAGMLSIGQLSTTSTVAHSQEPVIVAHRGASYDAPENTIPAFKLAWQKKADAIEGDFYLTRDKKIVCIHDKSTKRYCKTDLDVASSTFEELRQLDVGAYKSPKYEGTRIPSFKEVVETIPAKKKIYVEIKCGPEIVPVLDRELNKSKLKTEQVVIISFNSDVIRKFKQLRPQHKAFWLSGLKRPSQKISPELDKVVRTLQFTGADGFSSSFKHLDEKYLKSVQNRGFEYHVWTVNDPAIARKVADWGVQSITTDRPAFIREAISSAKE